jgi:hypothetical protein
MDGAHTHGHGGGGLGQVVVILLAVALLGPAVAAAVAELVHVLLIVAGVIVGVGAAGLVGLLAWQLRRTRVDAARAMPPRTLVARAAQPLPEPRRRSRGRGERLNYPPRTSMNLWAGFIFTSTA